MKFLRSILPFLRPSLSIWTVGLALAVPLAAIRGTPALMIKYGVDHILVGKDERALALFPLAIIGVFLVNFVVRFFHYYLVRMTILRVDQALKERLFRHFLGLSADYFTEKNAGLVISRIGSDTQFVGAGINAMGAFIREPVTFLGLFVYALTINWRLTLITLFIFPPLAWVFGQTGKHLKRYIGQLSKETDGIYGLANEVFGGFRVVQLFRLQRVLGDRFAERVANYQRIYRKITILEEAAHPLVELLMFVVLGALFYFGGRQVIDGRMSAGDLTAFFAAFALMINPLRTLNDVNMKLNQASGAMDRIEAALQWRSSVVELPEAERAPRPAGAGLSVEVTGLRFAYPDAPEREVLRDVSFSVPAGKVVAIVGPSGSGKSSMIHLLPRIFDSTGGEIRVGGVDVRRLGLEDLRSLIAVVSQDVFLFNDSIAANIRAGRAGATDAEVRDAARRAHVLEFAERLTSGLDTSVGDRGQRLSGGERQRVSIARAFLRNAPILLLDEATSSLDAKSEKVVQEAIEELMRDRTTVIVAHRLSTIRHAHEIIVLKDGKVVESGNHDRLLQSGGEYASLFKLLS